MWIALPRLSVWIALPRLCCIWMSPSTILGPTSLAADGSKAQHDDVAGFAGIKKAHVIGRVYTITPGQGECFYLASHQRTGVFALRRFGHLEDDNQYHLAMREAAVNNSAAILCSLFVAISAWCEPSNPLDIYDHHK